MWINRSTRSRQFELLFQRLSVKAKFVVCGDGHCVISSSGCQRCRGSRVHLLVDRVVVTGFRHHNTHPGAGQNIKSEISTSFGPFVVLLGQNHSDEPDQRIAVREDLDDIGPASDFLVQSFLYPVLTVGST